MSQWINHAGGTCPVDTNAWVSVELASGDIGTLRARSVAWRSVGPSAIVRYSVHGPEGTRREPDADPDPVNHPSHYTDGGIETIDYLEAKLGPDGFRAFCLGNALKYVSRAGKKGDLKQDLSKAIWYLRRIGGE
jgi:hypothetical protein